MRRTMKKWWQYLLLIPGCLLIDLLLYILAVYLDSAVTDSGQGHATPFISGTVLIILGIITVIVTLYALIQCVRSVVRSVKRQDGEDVYGGKKNTAAARKKKPVWRCFIPLIAEMILFTGALILCFRHEINAFYQDPAHIGFPIPAGTILLTVLFFIAAVITVIICVIAAVRRNEKNRQIGNGSE